MCVYTHRLNLLFLDGMFVLENKEHAFPSQGNRGSEGQEDAF